MPFIDAAEKNEEEKGDSAEGKNNDESAKSSDPVTQMLNAKRQLHQMEMEASPL
jgi:hypothetical protein